MRKPAFCICENKDADQLRGNRETDQRLCFRDIDRTIPLLSKSINFKLLAIFCGCTAWFVSDLVGNPEDRFSHNEAQIINKLPHEYQRETVESAAEDHWSSYWARTPHSKHSN